MNIKRTTIKRLPVTICEPYHPMFGVVQPSRFVYRIRDGGKLIRSGVTSTPATLKY